MDSIEIRGLRLRGRFGVAAAERAAELEVVADIAVQLPLQRAAQRFAREQEEPFYPEAVRLFIQEENMHSAYLAQFMAQRENYIMHGYNSRYITNRFRFYHEWLKNHKPQAGKISSEEAAFIANGVFDAWKQDKYKMYIKQSYTRAIMILGKADYNGCQDKNPEEHHRLMHRICNIQGVDFYRYIQGREQEFIQDLPQEKKAQFAARMKLKKKAMGYFEKVGELTDNNPQQKYKHFQNLKFKHNWNKFKEKFFGQ